VNVLIGFVSGVISGMGIGGGSILIPALVFFSHASQHQAQAVNLYYFIPTAVVSLIIHFKNRQICAKVSVVMALFGLIGAYFGSSLAVKLSDSFLAKIFAVFLFIVGIMEIINAKKNEG